MLHSGGPQKCNLTVIIYTPLTFTLSIWPFSSKSVETRAFPHLNKTAKGDALLPLSLFYFAVFHRHPVLWRWQDNKYIIKYKHREHLLYVRPLRGAMSVWLHNLHPKRIKLCYSSNKYLTGSSAQRLFIINLRWYESIFKHLWELPESEDRNMWSYYLKMTQHHLNVVRSEQSAPRQFILLIFPDRISAEYRRWCQCKRSDRRKKR